MSYLKRQNVPKNWPVPRKGTPYVAKPNSLGIPVVIVLRDMLDVAQNKKEVTKALYNKLILLNNKIVIDKNKGVGLFDVLTLVPEKKSYRMVLNDKGKFALEEITGNSVDKKIAKIVDKKTLKGKKTQLNLSDGRNLLSQVKCGTNDSIVVDFKNKKIEKILGFKEKAKVLVIAGKHAGEKGEIVKINEKMKMIEIKKGNENVNVLIKQIIIVE